MTFEDRCAIAAACLPRDDYRASLERLHAEMLAAIPQAGAEPVACVTECEACFTPDACQLRGTCDHYAASKLRIAPTAQPAPLPEPIMVEAVAEVCSGDDGLYLGWLVEGGICSLVEGCVLVMPHKPITDSYGSGEVYTAAPLPAREPLTDDRIDDILSEANRGFCIERADYFKAVRDAEAAHGITATTAAKEQT